MQRVNQVFTAEEPEGIGPEKYDETAAAMIAQLKYGSGVPFNRLEQLERQMGIPLPAATQWEIVEEAAEAVHIGQLEATLGAEARFAGFGLLLAGRRVRHEASVKMAGEGAQCREASLVRMTCACPGHG